MHVSINYHAEEGVDYVGETAEVSFLDSIEGDTACTDITIVDDNAVECNQDFTVSINDTSLPPYITSSQSQATVAIVDNDGKLTITQYVLQCILILRWK